MKQLVNKFDRNIRLIGLKSAVHEGEGILFPLPINEKRDINCFWPVADWDIADYNPQQERGKKGERPEFIAWLREQMKKKGYSAMGLSECLGYSSSWFSNFLQGRSRIKEADLPRLAKEFGVSEKTLRAHR